MWCKTQFVPLEKQLAIRAGGRLIVYSLNIGPKRIDSDSWHTDI
jgi:hypothetical protein